MTVSAGGRQVGADLLIAESAGLCNRCSPHIQGVLAICVVDNLSGIHTPRKIGPMLKLGRCGGDHQGRYRQPGRARGLCLQCPVGQPESRDLVLQWNHWPGSRRVGLPHWRGSPDPGAGGSAAAVSHALGGPVLIASARRSSATITRGAMFARCASRNPRDERPSALSLSGGIVELAPCHRRFFLAADGSRAKPERSLETWLMGLGR